MDRSAFSMQNSSLMMINPAALRRKNGKNSSPLKTYKELRPTSRSVGSNKLIPSLDEFKAAKQKRLAAKLAEAQEPEVVSEENVSSTNASSTATVDSFGSSTTCASLKSIESSTTSTALSDRSNGSSRVNAALDELLALSDSSSVTSTTSENSNEALDALKIEIHDLKEKLAQAEKLRDEAEQQRATAQQQCAATEDRCAQAERAAAKKVDEARIEMTEAASRHENAMMFQCRNLAQVREECRTLREASAKSTEATSLYSAKMQEFENHRQELEARGTQQLALITQLEQQLQDSQRRCTELQTQLEAALAELSALQRQLLTAQSETQKSASIQSALADQLVQREAKAKEEQERSATAILELKREYFYATAVGLKLSLFTNGRNVNFHLQEQYERLQQLNVPFNEWALWIQQEIIAASEREQELERRREQERRSQQQQQQQQRAAAAAAAAQPQKRTGTTLARSGSNSAAARTQRRW